MPMKVTYRPVKSADATTIVMSAVEQELYALAYEIQGRVQTQIADKMITATGAAGLLGSFQVTREVSAGGKVSAIRVGSIKPYASYVEFGTKPHFPPIRPLFLWVERKLDVIAYGVSFKSGKAKYTGRTVRQFGKGSSMERSKKIYAIARQVQRAIGRRGTRARLYMAATLESLGLPYSKGPSKTEGLVYSVNYAEWLKGRRGAIQSRLNMMLGGE